MNTLVTPSWVANETSIRWMGAVKGVANFNRTYDDQYMQGGAKVGYTVSARLPQRYAATRGQAWQPQALFDQVVPITLSYQSQVGFDWSSASGTMEIDRVRDRYVNPAADVLASDADQQGMADVYPAVFNAVGTPGTTPAANSTYLDAGVLITNAGDDGADRRCVVPPKFMASLVNANLTLFNPSAQISEQYRSGMFGRNALGVDEWYQDTNMPTHVTGSFTVCSPTVNTAGQTGSSIVTQAWASGATNLKKGDIVTFAGVFSVNRISRVSTGQLQQFTLLADASDTLGAMTLSISPSIIPTGALQTVSNSPANGAAISVWGSIAGGALTATTSKQGLLFRPDFAAFVTADLVDPVGGAKSSYARSKDFGISIRFVQQYLIGSDQNGSRLDILFGAAPIQPERCTRIVG